MKAIGIFDYGGPEVLRTVELPDPHAGAEQVRIRVRAAAVNPADVMLRTGLLNERYRDGVPPFVPGMDVAGVVDEVGEGVEKEYGWKVGQQVVAIVNNHHSVGGYSEYVVVPAASVAQKPARATFVEASTFLMNSLTARVALDSLALQPGAVLAVTGGAGAFGGYVIQLASSEGIHVIADASDADREVIRSFGAGDVVQRGANVAQRFRECAPEGVDAVADGALLFDDIAPAIRDGGQMAIVRGWDGDPGRGISVHRINVRNSSTDRTAITGLAAEVDRGTLSLRVAAAFPAERAADAHRMLDMGGVRGRIVLEF